MIDKLAKIADKFEEITALLSQPEIINDSKKLQNLAKEQAKILPIYDLFQVLNQKSIELSENTQMAGDSEEDPEMRELAKAEAITLTKEIEKLNRTLKSSCSLKIRMMIKTPSWKFERE